MIAMSRLLYKVDAYRTNDGQVHWCDGCGRWHFHGIPTWLTTRVPHCPWGMGYRAIQGAEIDLIVRGDAPASLNDALHRGQHLPPEAFGLESENEFPAGVERARVEIPPGWVVPPIIESCADFTSEPLLERRWLAAGLIPEGKVTMLSGDGGTGKSLLAMQLGISVATGRDFLGFKVHYGPVFAVFAEDEFDELHRRCDAICRKLDLPLSELDMFRFATRVGEDNVIVKFDRDGNPSQTQFLQHLESEIRQSQPALLILDNLAELFGGNENDRQQVRAFLSHLHRLCRDHQVTVLLVAHPSLSGLNSGSGLSGSTAWNNSVRARLYLDRPKGDEDTDSDLRILRTSKSNYGPSGSEIRLRWSDGAFEAPAAPSTLDRIATQSRADRVFMALLENLTDQGRTVSAAPTSSTYAPKLMARHPQAEGVTKREFEQAMERLFAKRLIREQQSGRPSRPVRIIVKASSSDIP